MYLDSSAYCDRKTKRTNLFLNLLFIFYAAGFPFSPAWIIHTAPWLMLALWIFEGDWKNKWLRIRYCKAAWFLLFFIGYSFLSLLWTENYHHATKNISHYLSMAVVFIVMLTSLKETFKRPILYAFLLAMFVSEIISYGIYFHLWTFAHVQPDNPSPFLHHIHYSVLLAVTVFLLLEQVLQTDLPKTLRIAEALFLVSTSVNLFINGGRTGQLALLFGAFVFIISRYGIQKKVLIGSAALLAAIYLGAYAFSPNFHHRIDQAVSDIEKIEKGNLHGSWGTRIAMKIVAFHLIAKHPLFGEGIGDDLKSLRHLVESVPAFHKYRFIERYQHSHDTYIQILLQSGAIGLLFFLSFITALYFAPAPPGYALTTLRVFVIIFIVTFFAEMIFYSVLANFLGFMGAFLYRRAVDTFPSKAQA